MDIDTFIHAAGQGVVDLMVMQGGSMDGEAVDLRPGSHIDARDIAAAAITRAIGAAIPDDAVMHLRGAADHLDTADWREVAALLRLLSEVIRVR
jgi:hypothetical protein